VPHSLKRMANAKADASADKLEYTLAKNDSLVEAFGTTRFSVCMQKSFGKPGYFIWNDHNPAHRSDLFKQVPVTGTFTWGVDLRNVRVSMASVGVGSSKAPIDVGCSDGCGAIVDSGTSLLVMPQAAAASLQAAIDAMGPFNCSSIEEQGFSPFPSLNFNLGGHELSLPPQAYVGVMVGLARNPLERFVSGRLPISCGYELAVMTEDAETQFGPLWILGMPFFREFYTTFDLGTAGRTPLHPDVAEAAATVEADVERPRSLFLAESDGECTTPGSHVPVEQELTHAKGASDGGSASLSWRPLGARLAHRHINASMLAMPHWISALYNGKKVHI